MRKISFGQILFFQVLLFTSIALGVLTTSFLLGGLPLGDFRGVTLVVSAVIFIYLYAFLVYRLFLRVLPLREGNIPEGSREEFAAQVNILFYLLLFNSLIRKHFIPVPLMRLVCLALGARLGENTWMPWVQLDLSPALRCGAHFAIVADNPPEKIEIIWSVDGLYNASG